jgi:putative transposase
MPRVPRRELPDGLFHVTVRGVEATAICRMHVDYERFLRVLAPVVRDRSWTCYSLCVLQTHYHLVVDSGVRDLATGMETLNGRYAKLFNRDAGRRGHLFGSRYRSKPIQDVRYLGEALRYVILNPVRAGLRAHPEDWPWGTYRALLGVDPAPEFLDVDRVLRLFGPTRELAREELRRFVAGPLRGDMAV